MDRRTVVINLGSENGVEGDSVFHILGDPERITDPDTNEILGSVKVTKGRVRASQVFDKFTIASTTWTQVNQSYAGVFGDLFGKVQQINEGDLNVDPNEIRPWKAKSESPIRVGDEVEVLVTIDEAEEAEPEDEQELAAPNQQIEQ